MSRVRRGREWVLELDPERSITDRQRQVLERVRAFGGNRSRAARSLGVTVQSVQYSIRQAAQAGCRVPDMPRAGGRGPDLGPRGRS